MIAWWEGTNLIAAPFGAAGLGARQEWTGNDGWQAAAGATTTPYVAWGNNGAVMLASPPGSASVIAGAVGAVSVAAGSPMAPRSQTFGTRAVAYYQSGATILRTESPAGLVTTTNLGATGLQLLDIAVAGDRVIAVWTDTDTDAPANRISVSTGPVGGPMAAPQAVSASGRWTDRAAVAMDPSGAGTVFWTEKSPKVTSPYGGWSTSAAGALRTLEVSPTGDVSPATSVPGTPTLGDTPRVARDPAGTTTFAFLASDGENLAGHPFIVERSASGAIGQASLEPGGWSGSNIHLATAADGTAVLAWQSPWKGITTAWRRTSGSWSAPQDADPSCSGRWLSSVAIGGGRALLTTSTGPDAYVSTATLDGPDAAVSCVASSWSRPPRSTPSTGAGPQTAPLRRRAAPAMSLVGRLRRGARTVRVRISCRAACTARLATSVDRGDTFVAGTVLRKRLAAHRPVTLTVKLGPRLRAELRRPRARLLLEISAPKAGYAAALRRIVVRPS